MDVTHDKLDIPATTESRLNLVDLQPPPPEVRKADAVISMIGSGDITGQQQVRDYIFNQLRDNGANTPQIQDSMNKALTDAKSDLKVDLEGPFAPHYPVHNLNANNNHFFDRFSLKDKGGNTVPGSELEIHWTRGSD